jgi:hypothetical protein
MELATVDLQHGPQLAPQHIGDGDQLPASVVDWRVQFEGQHTGSSQVVSGVRFSGRARALADFGKYPP